MFQMHSELRSITAVAIVEDLTKCPLGYTPIIRTTDGDVDADLWRDGFFGRRVTRYLCISKSQGRPEHVIQDIHILQEKELAPEGFTVIQQTTDSNQKALRRKQLCFKHAHFKQNVESIVDIMILSKLKNPPDGYHILGDINGMHLLVRKVSALTRLSNPTGPHLAYNLPGNAVYPSLHDSMSNLNVNGNGNIHRNSLPSSEPYSMPCSPAHLPMPAFSGQNANYNTSTLAHVTGIEGVPFVLRDELRPASGIGINARASPRSPVSVNIKNEVELDREYNYDFLVEREALYQGF